MSDKIKTREIIKIIKIIDKAGNVADRMKNAYIRTKDEAQHTQQSEHISPSEYASDNTTRGAENMAYETGHQLKKQTGKIVDQLKDARSAKKQAESVSEPIKEQAKKYTQQNMRKSTQTTKQATEKTIRTAPKVENTIKQSAKATGKTAKVTAKGTIKMAQKSIKSAEYTAKATIKTFQQTAKVAAKTTQATAKTSKAAAQVARVAAQAAKTTVKATIAAVKAAIATIKGLVALIAAGGWVAIVVILVICMIAFVIASPFAIFGGGGSNGVPTVTEVIGTVNTEWDTKIEQLKTDAGDVDETVITINGTVVTSVRAQNWADVLSVYSVKTSTGDEPTDVAEIDSNRIRILKSVFNDMNTVTSNTKITTDKDNNSIKKLTIEITSKNYIDMVSVYSFNSEQQEILSELMSEENRSMWQAITG